MYFYILSLAILAVKSDIDWWDVLSTDLSCCSTHSSSYDCSNEGANDCEFVDTTATCPAGKAGKECRFKQRLADEFGSCLQESFVSCKVAAGKIRACCAPGCKGINKNNVHLLCFKNQIWLNIESQRIATFKTYII